MNLHINDVFEWRNQTWRLLMFDQRIAYVIDISDPVAEPIRINVSEILECAPRRTESNSSIASKRISAKAQAHLNEKWEREREIFQHVNVLLDADIRARMIPELAEKIGCAPKTVEASLRRYWQRGQCKMALLPDFHRCGNHATNITACRGRRTKAHAIYQVTDDDVRQMRNIIETYYLDDERRTIIDAYDELCDRFYQFTDGNGDSFERPLGDRVSERQFRYFLKTNYPEEVVIRARKGARTFRLENEISLSDTISDCLGVGHKYEIDASIADIFIVSKFDRRKVIGKATVYFIIDRRSRLITGFYVGLENPSWDTAVEAILSCFEDKQALCTRYGVAYDPADWPADGLMPAVFVGDHGEMISIYSDALAGHFNATIENPTAQAPNWKPNVETRFKLLKASLRTIKGFDPPENRGKRRKKNYAREALLTLDELIKEILEHVIAHNRAPLKSDIRRPDQVSRRVVPSPISLWNDGVRQKSSHGREYSYEDVMVHLMPRGVANASKTGITFKKLAYKSDDETLRRRLIHAGDESIALKISYDRRIVDRIYIWVSENRAVEATLAGASADYAGMSFAEVKDIEDMRSESRPEHDQMARDVRREQRQSKRATEKAAAEHQRTFGPQSARSRTIDTAETRKQEKRYERTEVAGRRSSFLTPASDVSNVVGFPVPDVETSTPDNPAPVEDSELTPIQAARKRTLAL